MSETTIIQPIETLLRDCSGAITFHTGIIEERIAALHAEVLPTQLKIGLYCLRAHLSFSIQSPAKRGSMKGTKKLVHVDELSSQGFEGWLSKNHPTIKKPTAYRWMTAFKGLGLNESATEKDVDKELAKITDKALSLKFLCDAALEAVSPPAPEPPRIEQQEFDFLKQSLSAFRLEGEAITAIKDKLDAYPEFKRAAAARAYQILHDLTGTDWKPSDEPDDLASVDPDAIIL